MNNQQIFTKECKRLIGKPEPGMLCKIEYFRRGGWAFEIESVTYIAETKKQICCIDHNVLYKIVNKHRFIAFHTID